MAVQTNITGFGNNQFGINEFGLDSQVTFGTTPGGLDSTGLERSWFQVRVPGATPQTPLNQLKKEWYQKMTGRTSPFRGDLEREWLKEIIRDAGSNPSGTIYLADLWKEACAAVGLTPTVRMTENKKMFYQFVTD